MILIPAVDLRGGRVVRLRQGRYDDETVFDATPEEAAAELVRAGAQRLHVVDLDGARQGRRANIEQVRGILGAAGAVPVQVGGGLRDLSAIEALLGAGARWAILGTAALEDPELLGAAAQHFPGQILVGVDARDGRVAVRGWEEGSEVSAAELVSRVSDAGVAGIIYTNVRRDGTGEGPDLEGTVALAGGTKLPVVASGGVGSLGHIRQAAELGPQGVTGLIVGRALYDRAFSLQQALEAVKEVSGC